MKIRRDQIRRNRFQKSSGSENLTVTGIDREEHLPLEIGKDCKRGQKQKGGGKWSAFVRQAGDKEASLQRRSVGEICFITCNLESYWANGRVAKAL